MYKFTFLTLLFLSLSIFAYGQCAGIVLNNENFDSNTSGTWSAFDVSGDDSWNFGNGEAAMNGFGGSTDEDWLISPSIDLFTVTNATANFEYSDRFSGPDLQFVYSTDYSGTGDPNAATWTNLLTLTDQTGSGTLPSYISASVSLACITSSDVYFAFYYTTETTGSGPGEAEDWRVDNICISADNGTAICINCTDGILNGNETGIDCGGPDCPTCPDSCDAASPINCDQTINGNTTGGLNSYNTYLPDGYTNWNGPEAVYTFTVSTAGTYIIDLVYPGGTSTADLDIFLFDVCDPTQNYLAASFSPPNTAEQISSSLSVGTYYIIIDGDNTGAGAFELTLTCPDIPPTCTDGIQNGTETGIDCGGTCAPCNTGGGTYTGPYYDMIEADIVNGLECSLLKTDLYNLIDGHTAIPYSSSSTYDVRDFICDHETHLNDAGNATIIWDVYSDNPTGTEAYEYVCGPLVGAATMEGDGYNREHVFPKSWWGGSLTAIQHTDLHNLLPSDGYVNSQKLNYGLGETNTPNFTSTNGTMVGPATTGCNATVFEPIDEYKGDFARIYLYMAVRYENIIGGWETQNGTGNIFLDGNSYTVYETCVRNLLLDWHSADPVSDKERDRNDAIFGVQGNRNPFIDHPEYAGYIWGSSTGAACSTIAPSFIAPKVFLQGPLNAGTMTEALNTAGLVPMTEPYTSMGITGLQNANTTMSNALVNTGTTDAIVDWVIVELRTGSSAANATTVVAARAALVQRDGDVVDADGVSPLGFNNVSPGNYYVSIRHRNHLSVMTNNTITIN